MEPRPKKIIFLGKACAIRGDASRRGFEGGGKVSKLFCSSLSFFKVINNCFERWWRRGQTSRWPQVWTRKDRQTKMVTADPRSSWINQPSSFLSWANIFHLSDAFCFFSLGPHVTLYLHSYSLQRLSKAGLQRRHLRKLTSETDWPPNSLLLLYFTSWG